MEAQWIRYHVSGKICTSVPATHARSRARSFEIHGGDYPSRSPAYMRLLSLCPGAICRQRNARFPKLILRGLGQIDWFCFSHHTKGFELPQPYISQSTVQSQTLEDVVESPAGDREVRSKQKIIDYGRIALETFFPAPSRMNES